MTTNNILKSNLKGFKPNMGDFKDISPSDLKNETKTKIKHLESKKKQSKNKRHPLLNDDIINQLPLVLKQGIHRLVDDNDKLVYLVSAIGILSGIMPNVSGYYDGKKVAPNLFVFIVGDYGSGKGAMSYAKILIRKIEDDIQADNEQELLEWRALPKKEKAITPEPRPKGIIIPANASASAFLQMLNDNKGKGILFETEGDTLAQTLTTDHGNYSDILRKSFHHEFTAMARRTNSERIRLNRPNLAVVLTGTPNQFLRLIPDTENGLFSRFLYLTIEAEKGFRDVFNKAKTNYEIEFEELGETVYNLHSFLTSLSSDEEIIFEFTEDQKKKFCKFYQSEKPKFIADTGEDAAGIFHRLALINFRIAMLFSTLRYFENKKSFSNKIYCSDTDYSIANYVTNELFKEAMNVYYKLPEKRDEKEELNDKISKDDPEVKAIIALKMQGLGVREISKRLKTDYNIQMGKTKVGQLLQEYKKKGIVRKTDTSGHLSN